MNCWHCNAKLIWGGDHDIDEDEGMEYDIVTNLTCPKCESYVEAVSYTHLTLPTICSV